MSRFWNKNTAALSPYTPGEQPKDGEKLIKLNTNECPYPPSPKVTEAISAANNELLRLYPDPDASAVRRAFAGLNGLEPGQVFVGNGSDEVLAVAFQAFFGDGTLRFPAVSYSFYPVYCGLYQIPYEAVPMNCDFSLDVDAFLKPGSQGVVIANPNAPTTRFLPLNEIERILQAHPDEVVLVDEAYVDFGGASAIPLIQKYDNLLVVQTLSKSRALAGLRVGFAAGSRELIEGLDRVKNSFNSYTLDRLAIAGAEAAINDRAYFESVVQRIETTRARTAAALEALGFTMPDSASNFLFVTHPIYSAEKLFTYLKQNHILVRYFSTPPLDRFLRITIGTDAEMDALLAALRSYREA